jgi:hypothetical protein
MKQIEKEIVSDKEKLKNLEDSSRNDPKARTFRRKMISNGEHVLSILANLQN